MILNCGNIKICYLMKSFFKCFVGKFVQLFNVVAFVVKVGVSSIITLKLTDNTFGKY